MTQTGKENACRTVIPELLDWYDRNARKLPWRQTKDPYFIWVSEIMLQQTRVETVIPYYHRFLSKLPTIQDLAQAEDETLMKLWEGLGYYSRVKNMRRAAQEICQTNGGQMPCEYDQIRKLCGIGDYTAGAIASFAFGKPFPAVDGNVMRVAARLRDDSSNILQSQTKKETTAFIRDLMPLDDAARFNQAMIELGATVCKPTGMAGGPDCEKCPFGRVCLARLNGHEFELPNRVPILKHKEEDRTVFKIWMGDKVAIQKRPDTGLLASLFEFPNASGKLDMAQAVRWLKQKGFSVIRMAEMPESKHVFTHLTWHMTAWSILVSEDTVVPEGVLFVSNEELLSRYAVPKAFGAYIEQKGFFDNTQ